MEIVGTTLQAGNSLITGGAIAVSSLRLNDPLLPQKVHAVLHNITISHMLLQGVPRGGAVCLRSCNATLQQMQVVGAHTHLNEPDEVKGTPVLSTFRLMLLGVLADMPSNSYCCRRRSCCRGLAVVVDEWDCAQLYLLRLFGRCGRWFARSKQQSVAAQRFILQKWIQQF